MREKTFFFPHGLGTRLHYFWPHQIHFIFLQTTTGEAALHFACQKHWPSTTKQLVMAGADLTIMNHVGFTPFLVAVVEGFYL